LLRPLEVVPLFALFGVHPLALRAPAFLYTALTGVVVFCWARAAFGIGAAYFACLLTLLNANLYFYSDFATDDTRLAFFFTAAAALLWRALRSRRTEHFFVAGAAAALGVLEKPTGVVFLCLCAAAALRLMLTGADRRRVVRWIVALCAPIGVAMVLYAIRNLAAHQTVGFRVGPLDWILRAGGMDTVMQVFDRPPTLLATLRDIGWARVAAIAARDVQRFGMMLFKVTPLAGDNFGPLGLPEQLMVPVVLPALACAGLAIYWRRDPDMSALLVASLVGAVVVNCILWHFEVRYFSFLIPLLAIWVGGVFAAAARFGTVARVTSIGVAVVVLVLNVRTLAVAELVRSLYWSEGTLCQPAANWVTAHTATHEPVMVFD